MRATESMKEDMKELRDSELFSGFSESEYDEAMKNINAGEFSYTKNQIILSAGDITPNMGVVIEGSVIVESNNLWGSNFILGMSKTGGFFAETYALSGRVLMVDVRANENSRIRFLRINGLNAYSDTWAFKLMKNLLYITARKNIYLSERSFINANRTIRQKVMSYLNSIALREHSNEITIPFNRQQMADYLNTDRSALSKELCSMRDDGIIEFRKNHFVLVLENHSSQF